MCTSGIRVPSGIRVLSSLPQLLGALPVVGDEALSPPEGAEDGGCGCLVQGWLHVKLIPEHSDAEAGITVAELPLCLCSDDDPDPDQG